MIFDALYIARGWLAVRLAAADKGAEMPGFARSMHIEQHAAGVRLVATDSYVLLCSWVPDLEHSIEDEPGLDETPIAVATALDPHHRAKGFLAHALKLATADDAPQIDVRVRLNVGGLVDDRRPSLPGLEVRSVVLEMPDVERVVLDCWDGPWAAWRSVLGNLRPVDTRVIALNPDIVGRLAKVGPIHPGSLLGWTFGGPTRPARLDVINSEPPVEGLVMPCRWDFDRDAPRDEPAPPTDVDDGEGA